MRKFLKYLFWSFLFLGILFLGIWKYLNYQFDQNFDELKYNQLKLSIQKTPDLPTSFLNTYKKLNSITDSKGITSDLFQEKYNRTCPCYSLSTGVPMNNSLHRFILANRLEKEFSQEQCLAYLTSKFDFSYGINGISNASHFYFKKNLKDLKELEMQTLVLMLRNPILFNPIKNPENVKLELEKMKEYRTQL